MRLAVAEGLWTGSYAASTLGQQQPVAASSSYKIGKGRGGGGELTGV